MKFVIFIFFFLINFGVYSFCFFDSYKAHALYQKGDYQGAQHIYENNLIKKPDDLNLNFNLGDVLYRQEKYDQALPYFSRVIDHQKVTEEFKEQTYFNRGNNYVKLSKFESAIKDYESAIEINPSNERAKHNLELAKKLLKQQQQQQQENQQQKNQGQGKQQEQQKNQEKDQKNKNKSESDKEKEEPGQEPNDNKKNSNAQNDKEKNWNDEENQKQKSDEQKNEDQQRDNHNLNKNVNQNEKKNEEKSNPQDTQKSQIDKQSKEEQEGSANGNKSNLQGEKNAGEVASQADKNGEIEQSDEMIKFLQLLDEKDKKNNKELIRMKINKGIEENNGQKNW